MHRWLSGLVLLGVVCSVAVAEEAAVTNQLPARGDIALTLERTVMLALKNNAGLKTAELENQIADWGVTGEQTYWEPEFVLSTDYEDNKRENTVEQALSQFTPFFAEENWTYSAALEGKLPSGASYRMGYTLEDLANNLTNLTFREQQAYESQYVSFLGLSITQPLLKNAGRRVTRGELENAELRREIALQELRRQQMITIARAEVAYWNAWRTAQSVDFRAQSLKIAHALVKDNEERFKQGKMAEIEVAQAKAGRALRERRWLEARTQQSEAVRALMNVLNWSMEDHAVTVDDGERALPPPPDIDFVPRIRATLERHPDMLIAKKQIDVEELRLAVSKNQRWPQLDLVGSYGLNGLDDSMSDSLDDVTGMDFESWSVGIHMRVPLGGGRDTRAQLRQAELRKEKALQQYKATETEVANALAAVLRKVELLGKTFKSLEEEVEINRMALESEQLLLENGKSTSRRVLELEEDLSDSQVEHVGTSAMYLRALVELDLADGGMLERRGLDGVEDEAPAAADADAQPAEEA